jgi:signal transduction histidine kinase
MPEMVLSSESRLNVKENDQDNHLVTLLYVEDDSDSRAEFIEIMCIRYPDLQLLVAVNGKEGLTSFKQNHPEIVVTDINMPVMNGIDMSAEIRAINPATEIIVLTAYSDTSYLMQAIEIGISNFIMKPTNVEQLFKVIDKALVRFKSERENARQNKLILDLNTELVRKTGELESANQELAAFDYTIAHDLRSPMVNISGFSQLLLDHHASVLDDDGKRHLQIIIKETNRLNKLIESLLEFSVQTRKRVHKTWTCLSEIAHEVRANFLVQEPGRHATFCIAEGVNGFGDPNLLWVVLQNLLGNAWKFTLNKDDALIEFGSTCKGDELIYFVRDNGPGFDQLDSEKLFAPFHRIQNNDAIEGFGIGLATARKIIVRHGGKIWAEGEPGKGAAFYFTL